VRYGGGPVWTAPAIDPQRGLAYIAIGNVGPDNDGSTPLVGIEEPAPPEPPTTQPGVAR
jgi:hypothetical protein